jgi:HK97 family phage portal protein
MTAQFKSKAYSPYTFQYNPKPKPRKTETKSMFPPLDVFDDNLRIVLSGEGSQSDWKASYRNNAKYGHIQNPYVYACVNKIQQTVCGIPVFLVQHMPDEKDPSKDVEKPVEDPENPMVKLFMRPNEAKNQNWEAWLKERIGHKYYAGEWFTYKNVVSGGEVTELTNLDPSKMDVKLNADKTTIDHYEYTPEGTAIPYQPDQISHVKTWNPLDDWRGLAPVTVARSVIITYDKAKEYNKSLLDNLAIPGGAYSYPGRLSDDQLKRLRQQIHDKYEGPKNAGKWMIMEGGATIQQPTQYTAHDLDFIEGQKMLARDFSIIFQVPSELLNDSTNKTYNNQKEAIGIFYHDCILPLLGEIIAELNEFVVRPYDQSLELKYDKDGIEALKEDQTQKVQRDALKVQSGISSPNEIRPDYGLSSDVVGGDSLFVSGNLVPIGSTKVNTPTTKAPQQVPHPQQTQQQQGKSINLEEMR